MSSASLRQAVRMERSGDAGGDGAARASRAPGAARLATPVLAALAAVYVVWGSTYYAMRVALEGFPPLLMGGLRFLTAGSVLYAVLRLRGAPAPTAREWRSSAALGALFLACGNGGVAIGEQYASSGLAAVVVASMPLWAALLGTALGRRPSRVEWVALLVGFAGVALLNAGGDLRMRGPGTLALVAAPVCWALGTVLTPRMALPAGAMATAAQMLAGGAEMLAAGLARGERLGAWPSARAAAALVYLVVFGSLVGFSAYGYLLRHTRPVLATSYAYVNPVIAVGLGVVLAGERVGPLTLVAACVVLAGVAILSLARGRGAAAPAR